MFESQSCNTCSPPGVRRFDHPQLQRQGRRTLLGARGTWPAARVETVARLAGHHPQLQGVVHQPQHWRVHPPDFSGESRMMLDDAAKSCHSKWPRKSGYVKVLCFYGWLDGTCSQTGPPQQTELESATSLVGSQLDGANRCRKPAYGFGNLFLHAFLSQ